jgi:O-antigen ligase
MFITKKLSIYSFTIWVTALATVAATPFLNKDALIIPKVVVLFLGILFLFPYLFSSGNNAQSSKLILCLKIILSLMIVQISIVILVSDSPFEQMLFGRNGRGFGLITWISILGLCFVAATSIDSLNSQKLISGLGISGLFAIVYSLFQSFGLDFFPWDSKTNGVIGTLGNPNFVSSFTAMISIPMFVYINNKIKNNRIFANLILMVVLLIAVYRAQSTQGYITLAIAFTVFLLIYYWYQSKFIFLGILSLFIISTSFTVAGVLKNGPLQSYLYKISVQSRGEFWATAIATANAHPLFGVGLDSFGDYSLKYRKTNIIGEYTDSAHNYFLDYAANAGYFFAFLNLLLVLLTLVSFLKIQKITGRFDPYIASLFSAYGVFHAQSLISPICIPLIAWNLVISGSVIGLAALSLQQSKTGGIKKVPQLKLSSVFMVLLGVLIIFPYVNTDRQQLNAMNNGDGNLAIKVAKMYPESVVRYYTLSRALFDSGLPIPALDIARSAVAFNPNSAALWSLIVANQTAPLEERKAAYYKLLKLDPLNQEIINYKF